MKKTILPALFISVAFLSCGGKTETKTADGKPDGKALFETQCARCHGSNGRMGLGGAKDLTVTALTPDEMLPIITGGKNGGLMPAFGEVLTPDEIKAVAQYVETDLKN